MLLSTTDVLQNREIREYLGVVTAEVVFGSNAFRDFFAGIRDVVGGRTGAYEELFEKAHKESLQELEQRARRINADGVVGIRFNTSTINVDQKGVLVMATATGTAVKL